MVIEAGDFQLRTDWRFFRLFRKNYAHLVKLLAFRSMRIATMCALSMPVTLQLPPGRFSVHLSVLRHQDRPRNTIRMQGACRRKLIWNIDHTPSVHSCESKEWSLQNKCERCSNKSKSTRIFSITNALVCARSREPKQIEPSKPTESNSLIPLNIKVHTSRNFYDPRRDSGADF